MDNVNVLDGIVALTSVVSIVLSICALVSANKNNRKVQTVQKNLHSIGLSLSQRQHIIPLWQHVKDLQRIDRESPVAEVVRVNLNALELLAACRHYAVVDPDIFDAIMRTVTLKICEDIQAVRSLLYNGESHTGRELLGEVPLVHALYERYRREKVEPKAAPPLGGP